MRDQWNELKASITELRDSGGTGTQQEVCKYLVSLMVVLEKQMQEPCDDCLSRQQAIEVFADVHPLDYNAQAYLEKIRSLPPAEPEITLEYIKKYCEKRGLVILTSEFYNKMKSRLSSAEPERKIGQWTDDNACPFCGCLPWFAHDIHTLSFCPNCGADMRGKKHEMEEL